MAARKSSVSIKKDTSGSSPSAGSVVVVRNSKTGRFASQQSVRSIEKNSQKYSAVLKRLAKK